MPTLQTAHSKFQALLKHTMLGALLLSPTVALADWSGAYAGAQLDVLTGDEVSLGFAAQSFEDVIETDTIISGFAGYQLQQGDFVIGGELSLGQANGVRFEDVDGLDTDVRLVDVKARVGYDLGDALVYGVAGFSQSRLLDIDEDDLEGLDLETSTGVNYGFGVDYRVTEQFTVGAEYLIRELTAEDDVNEFFNARVDTQFETFGVRAAFNF
ncbi:outer membrane protein [Roseobacter sp. CCS2]|uniref:outer membrane protein n=1 Tax=Roseobacter sp. CCS2 TaxID=391593 RepID=UPI0000F3E578|nr:outer membrane beta-barrel protein [Roseobacter sp. CCS2]EBA11094.1 outer membrane protein, putative [Roseobacter sp. CCS2]